MGISFSPISKFSVCLNLTWVIKRSEIYYGISQKFGTWKLETKKKLIF